jgi:hypothetical protein
VGDFFVFLVDNNDSLVFEDEFIWNKKEKVSEFKNKKLLLFNI